MLFIWFYCVLCGPGSVVGVEAVYGLDGLGIESRWGSRFSTPLQTGPGVQPASCTVGTSSFPRVKSGRGVMLTPHPLLMPWSWKSRAIHLLPLWTVRPVQRLSVCARVHFTIFTPVILLKTHFSPKILKCFVCYIFVVHFTLNSFMILRFVSAYNVTTCCLTYLKTDNRLKKGLQNCKRRCASFTKNIRFLNFRFMVPYIVVITWIKTPIRCTLIPLLVPTWYTILT